MTRHEPPFSATSIACHDSGPFRPDWESLEKYEVPEWYQDAKFGIFIHWGVYSVPPSATNGIREICIGRDPRSTSTTSQPTARRTSSATRISFPCSRPNISTRPRGPVCFKDGGIKYVVPVAEHHDGFAMYDSGLSDWTAAKMGPSATSIGDLAKAVRAEGLHFGASSHRVEHNFFLGVGRTIPSDVNDPQYAAFYGPAHTWLRQSEGHAVSERLHLRLSRPGPTTGWREPPRSSRNIIPTSCTSTGGSASPRCARTSPASPPSTTTLRCKYGDHVGVINYKDFAMQEHSAVLDLERGQLADIRPLHWQTDTSISNKSWGYIQENDTFKSPQFVIDQLIDIVSKNGNLLLNIGPRSDGTIPEEVQAVLRDVGSWLKVNGDAIYDTRPGGSMGKAQPKSQPAPSTIPTPPPIPPKTFALRPKATPCTRSSWVGLSAAKRLSMPWAVQWAARR
jgi:alpha-L-fucosidase